MTKSGSNVNITLAAPLNSGPTWSVSFTTDGRRYLVLGRRRHADPTTMDIGLARRANQTTAAVGLFHGTLDRLDQGQDSRLATPTTTAADRNETGRRHAILLEHRTGWVRRTWSRGRVSGRVQAGTATRHGNDPVDTDTTTTRPALCTHTRIIGADSTYPCVCTDRGDPIRDTRITRPCPRTDRRNPIHVNDRPTHRPGNLRLGRDIGRV